MKAGKSRAVQIVSLAVPMRRTRIVEEDRAPMAVVIVVSAIIYIIVSLGLSLFHFETMLGVVTGVILATIAVLAVLFWFTRRKWSS